MLGENVPPTCLPARQVPQPVGLTGLNPTGSSSAGTGRPATEASHQPVILKEVLEFLRVAPGKRYIDATLGLAGHTGAILNQGGEVLGIEVDAASLALVEGRLARAAQGATSPSRGSALRGGNYRFVSGNFKDIGRIARENGFTQVDGVLFDLGMSSWQLERSGRGFSFQKDEPLDMRMDTGLKVTAADLVNGLYEKELGQLFRKFGQDPWHRRYARALVEQRQREPIRTTKQLADLIVRAAGRPSAGEWRRHPATRVFQALRLAVNDELGNLEKALPQALELIKPGGRLAVVSFHSLEDGIVKKFITDSRRLGEPLPAGRQGFAPIRILTPKPVTPSREELELNPRARSAKLRSIEKLVVRG